MNEADKRKLRGILQKIDTLKKEVEDLVTPTTQKVHYLTTEFTESTEKKHLFSSPLCSL